MTHLFLAEQRFADTAQAEQSDVARPTTLQICGRLRQNAQLVDAIGEYFQRRTCSPAVHGTLLSVIRPIGRLTEL
ncbi:MAG: hypothetical protein HZY76_09030 [Anaerolineae bacterium]|nr:MAG: hypothetical protein HZY76_09030 [Anaerolineae bacterium]